MLSVSDSWLRLTASPTFFQNTQLRRVVLAGLLISAVSGVALYCLNKLSSRTCFVLKGRLKEVFSMTNKALLGLSPFKKRAVSSKVAYQMALQAPNLLKFIKENKGLARSIIVTPELQAKMAAEIKDYEMLSCVSSSYGGGFWEAGWVTDQFVQQKGIEYVITYANFFLRIDFGEMPVWIDSRHVPQGTRNIYLEAEQAVKSKKVHVEAALQRLRKEENGSREELEIKCLELIRLRDESLEAIKAKFIQDLLSLLPSRL